MIKIMSSADWHVNLHKKKVPYKWQTNRFKLMFERMSRLEKDCDVHVIAGDLFDKKPEPDEICLVLSYLNSVTIPTYIIPGNHEATKKGETFWEHFTLENTINNPMVKVFTKNSREVFRSQGFCFFPYGEVQTDNLPQYVDGDILVTHIRGEVPPHITPEYDFAYLAPWGLCLLGDLHFNHRYLDTNCYYPGSPINTTFDRDDNRDYGIDIFNLVDSRNYTREFINLKLPKLIRRTIKVGELMSADSYHHVMYEVTGSIDELSRVEKSDLLDKKMVEKPASDSTLDLKGMTIYEELKTYLTHIKVSDVDKVLLEFENVNQT